MQNMLATNSNLNNSNLVQHAHMKLFDLFVKMILWKVEMELINSLWYSLMVHQQSRQGPPVKQGHFKIQAGFQTVVVMMS